MHPFKTRAAAAVLLSLRSRYLRGSLMRLVGRLPGVREIVGYELAVSFCATLGTLTNSGPDTATNVTVTDTTARSSSCSSTVGAVQSN